MDPGAYSGRRAYFGDCDRDLSAASACAAFRVVGRSDQGPSVRRCPHPFLQRMTPPGSGYDFYDMQAYEPMSRTGAPRLVEYDPEWITAHGFQYVVESEGSMKRFFRAPERYPLPFRFQRWLADNGELVFTTHPGSRGWVDWKNSPMRLREIEPWCGVSGGEFRVYRIK